MLAKPSIRVWMPAGLQYCGKLMLLEILYGGGFVDFVKHHQTYFDVGAEKWSVT